MRLHKKKEKKRVRVAGLYLCYYLHEGDELENRRSMRSRRPARTLSNRLFASWLCNDLCIWSCSSIRLQELGPRLTLELMKVERGLCEGEVLYHSYVTKTAEEVSSDAAQSVTASSWIIVDYSCCCCLHPYAKSRI